MTVDEMIKDNTKAWEWAMGWVESCKTGTHTGVRRIHELATWVKGRYHTNGLWNPDAQPVYDILIEAAGLAQEAYEDAQPSME